MNINLSVGASFFISLFILGLIGLEIYNGRISTSRSIRPHPDWTRKSYPYSFWIVIAVQLALAVYLICFSIGLAPALPTSIG
jgi:hypothetical protein